jgi:acetyl-CoA carboxylase biotin carboxyl carrier protein
MLWSISWRDRRFRRPLQERHEVSSAGREQDSGASGSVLVPGNAKIADDSVRGLEHGGGMDEAQLKRLIRMVEESDIEELEVDRPFGRIRITKKRAQEAAPTPAAREAAPPAFSPAPAASLPPVAVAPQAAVEAPVPKRSGAAIVAPMVGTFYAAPAPGAKPYVSVGDTVKVGQVVCIVEAMKLMNEVQSELAGTVAKVCVESGQAVEYGQELFHVTPA